MLFDFDSFGYGHLVGLFVGWISMYVMYDVLFRKRPEYVNGRKVSIVPPRYPILGHIPDLLPSTILATFEKNRRLYGSFVDCYIFNDRKRVICDPAILKELLSMRPKGFRRPLPQTSDGPFHVVGMKSALFNAEGALWSKMRRLISPHFSRQNVSSMVDTISHECIHMIHRLRKDCLDKHSGAETGVTANTISNVNSEKVAIPLDQMAQIYSVRVVGKVALGITTDEGMDEYFGTSLIITDTKAIFKYLLEKQLFPLPTFFWKNSSKFIFEREAVEASKRIENFTKVHIKTYKGESHQRRGSAGGGSSSSLIDSMLRAAANESVSDDEISENVRILFIAGSETTSSTITWTLYLLFVLHPAWLAAVRKEVEEVLRLGAGTTPGEGVCALERPLTNEELRTGLPVTLGCVKEAIRLYPAVSFFGLQLQTGGSSSGGVTLSNGMQIGPSDVIWAYSEGALMDSSAFGPNPAEFNPARWVALADPGRSAELATANSTLDLAFGGGPRVCPGMGLAMLEATAFVAYFAVHFDAQLACPQAEIMRVLEFTAKCNKMPMFLTPRKGSTA